MADVVVSEIMDDAGVAALRDRFDVLYDPGLVDRRPDLLAAVAGARALVVRNRTMVDDEVLAAAPALIVVGRLGVGLDNIDVEACHRRGVAVEAAVGANAVAVAEYVIAALLLLLRGAYRSTAEVTAGRWPRTELVGKEAHGKRLGLVGLGGIARAVAVRARALEMELAAHDPFLPDDDPAWSGIASLPLDDLLAASDVVSIHVPLTAATRHLIDGRRLALLPTGAVVVNTSRGGVIDEAALVAGLRSGHLGGAALDVFEHEPLDAAAGSVFAGLPNVILTPHIAGLTAESNARVGALVAARVAAHLVGRP